MFLRNLKSDQKPLFLGLAYQAALANGVVEAAEKRLIKALSEELGIREDDYSELSSDEICHRLSEISTRKELMEISFEILGIVMSDDCYDEDEKEFVGKMSSIFGVSRELLNQMEESIKEYQRIYQKIESLINL